MRALLRLGGVREYLRSSLWVFPALFVVAAWILGTVLSLVRPEVGTVLDAIVFGGTPEGARELLSALAGALITVTGLTFSLTVVALQMAAGQYSPRVLRGFLADRGNQLTLSTLVGTFAYTVAVLRQIREDDGSGEEVLPELAVTGAVALTLVALGMLVYFLHHLTRQLRVETILAQIAEDTLRTVDRVFPDAAGTHPRRLLPETGEDVVRVPARRSGYLQAVERRGLVRMATERDVIVHLRPGVGEHVTRGTTLAWIWRGEGRPFAPDEQEGFGDLVHQRVQLGGERTMQQDVAFGLRQLVDIAVRALSPSLNDPTTAVETLGHLSVVLCRLAGRDLGNAVDADEELEIRSIVPRPDFPAVLDLAVDQVLRHGADEPAVVDALLRLLGDLAEQAPPSERRRDLETQVDRVLAVAGGALDAQELLPVVTAAEEVRATLSSGGRPRPHGTAG
jgi:uncharacterized membrane protein